MTGPSQTARLLERASRRRDASTYAFIDYEADPNGISETVALGQVHQRAQVVAEDPCVVSVADRVSDIATGFR